MSVEPGKELSTIKPGARSVPAIRSNRTLPVVSGAVGLTGVALIIVNGASFLTVGMAAGGFVFALLFWLWAMLAQAGSGMAATELADTDGSGRARELKRALYKAQFDDAAGPVAEQAVAQLDQATALVTAFRRTLDTKFSRTEVTYERYSSAAEMVYQAVIARLESVSTALAQLRGSGAAVSEERLEIRQAQLGRIREMTGENERALAELERITSAVGSITTTQAGGNVDLDSALEQLRELAARAQKYSIEERK